MKITARCLVAAIATILGISAHASNPLFGNSPDGGFGFSIVDYNGMAMSGGAVEFTPQGSLDLGSITLWLSGYTGQSGQSIDASIWSSSRNAPGVPLINFQSPTADDGSSAAFTFSSPSVNPYDVPSGSTVLSGNTAYWLVVTAQGRPGNYIDAASWVGGSVPTGVAVYDGADTYNVSGGIFSASSDTPAFSINDNSNSSPIFLESVPEPGTMSLMAVAALVGVGRKLHAHRKSHG